MQFHKFLVFLALVTSPGLAASQGFDMNAAIESAGKLVDPGITKVYLFYIPSDSPIDSTSKMLGANLSDLAASKGTIKVIGPNFAVTFAILKSALQSARSGSLDGAIVIYVGDDHDFGELDKLAVVSGAIFRATTCCAK